MARRLKSTNRRRARTALLAALLAGAVAPAAAGAAPAATDEYSLGPVGSGTIGRADVQRRPEQGLPKATSPGVVGEEAASESPLEAIGSVAAPGTWVLVALLALGGAVFLARVPRERAR